MQDDLKEQQERKALLNIRDSFKKIIIINGYSKPRMDENGIITMGVLNFLLDEDSLDI